MSKNITKIFIFKLSIFSFLMLVKQILKPSLAVYAKIIILILLPKMVKAYLLASFFQNLTK